LKGSILRGGKEKVNSEEETLGPGKESEHIGLGKREGWRHEVKPEARG